MHAQESPDSLETCPQGVLADPGLSDGRPIQARSASAAPATLFCIPHAGGSAAYYMPLKRCLAPHIDVRPLELAGRGRRSREPLMTSMDAMGKDLFAYVAPVARSAPYALFGHSMGALLTLLCAAQAHTLDLPLPKAIFISACAPPNEMRQPLPVPISALTPAQLRRHVEKLGGIPPCIAASAEFCSYLEPILHADFTALDTWRPEPIPPLPVPLAVLRGDQDILSEPSARAWRKYTTSAFSIHSFPGNHFYVQNNWEALGAHLTQTLARLDHAR